MLVIYISVPVCTLCGRGQNIDEKYDQCIFYFLRRPCHYRVLSHVGWCKQTGSILYGCPNPVFYCMWHFKSASAVTAEWGRVVENGRHNPSGGV